MNKIIVLLVGPSGAGKSTLINQTFTNSQYIRSTTTRDIRPGETNGRDYLFTSKSKFKQLINDDGLVQYVKYDNNYYGVTKDEILDKLKTEDVVALPVIYDAVDMFKDYANQNGIKVLTVFLSISKKTLLKHFQSRTDTPEEKQDRISRYSEEIQIQDKFNQHYILNMNINDHALAASKQLQYLINELH